MKFILITLFTLFVGTCTVIGQSNQIDSSRYCAYDFETCGDNLVQNGDFDNGYNDFTTEFNKHGDTDPTGGTYDIQNCRTYIVAQSPNQVWPSQWSTSNDVTEFTSNQGSSLICNAQCPLASGGSLTPLTVWSQQGISVVEGQQYVFSVWISNSNYNQINNTTTPVSTPNLIMLADNQPVGSAIISGNTNNAGNNRWYQYCGLYTATTTGDITLGISSLPNAAYTNQGGDFALDEISFKRLSPGSPGFSISRQSECINDLIRLEADNQFGQHEWSYSLGVIELGSGNSSLEFVKFQSGGSKNITHTIKALDGGCSSSVTKTINVNASCLYEPCTPNFDLNDCGFEIAVNGGFENDTNDFKTELVFSTSQNLDCGGRFLLTDGLTGISDYDSEAWISTLAPKAGDTFMLVDPPCNSDGVVVWKQKVQLKDSTEYRFGCWVASLASSGAKGIGYLKIDGEIKQIFDLNTIGNNWSEVCTQYFNLQAGSKIFSIELASSKDGDLNADFALDDISVYESFNFDIEFDIIEGDNLGYCEDLTTRFINNQSNTHPFASFIERTFYFESVDNNNNSFQSTAFPQQLGSISSVDFEHGLWSAKLEFDYKLSDGTTVCKTTSDTIQFEIVECCEVKVDSIYISDQNGINGCDPEIEFIYSHNPNLRYVKKEYDSISYFTSSGNDTLIFIDEELYHNGGQFELDFQAHNTPHVFNQIVPIGHAGPIKVKSSIIGKPHKNSSSTNQCSSEVTRWIYQNTCDSVICSINPGIEVEDILVCSSQGKEFHLKDTSIAIPSAEFWENSGAGDVIEEWRIVQSNNPTATQVLNGEKVTFCAEPIAGQYGTCTIQFRKFVQTTNGVGGCEESAFYELNLETGVLTEQYSTSSQINSQTNEGVQSESAQNSVLVNVQPNPMSQSLNITVTDDEGNPLLSTVKLLDLNGKVITTINNRALSDINWQKPTLLSEGIYLIKIENSKGTFIRRLLIKNN